MAKRNTNLYLPGVEETMILTASGCSIIVDSEDVAKVSQYTWCIEGTGYAMSRSFGRAVKLHRIVMDAPKDMCVDHINGDRLDNRKQNLRLCRKQQNEFNTKTRADNKCGYRGVCWSPTRKKYRSYINRDGHQFHLGYFDSAEDAALAYNKSAAELFGEFARLNEVRANERIRT